MSYPTILIGVDAPGAWVPRLPLALELAKASQGRLIGALINPPPFMPASLGEGAAYAGPEIMDAQLEANEERLSEVQKAFLAATRDSGVPVTFMSIEGDAGDGLAELARLADLTIIGQSGGEGLDIITAETADRVVMGAGGPVLVLPRHQTPSSLPASWLVAWNNSKESARAILGAMPFLKLAQRVVLVAAGEEFHESVDFAADRLRGHGIEPDVQKLPAASGEIGDVLSDTARTLGLEGIVMGAYGRSRLSELIMGGATLHIVRHAQVPVLFNG